jgi:TPR repeat protein
VTRSTSVSAGEVEEAAILLAYLHLDGWLVPRSYSEGVRWLRFAADRGSTIASTLLGCHDAPT